MRNPSSKIRIRNVDLSFEKEPLQPYHFKGSTITQNWQVVALLEGESGVKKIGLGNQGILWSDARVFAAHSEDEGNLLMYALSKRALQIIKGTIFESPIDLLDRLLPEIHAYGKRITGNPDLKKTFALNSLVCIDNAAWLLYAYENRKNNFDDLVPNTYRQGLSFRHKKVASIPSFPVGTEIENIKNTADQGYFIMKLKTGSAGSQKQMLEQDISFFSAVHQSIGHYETSYTKNGKIAYYIDPNGRYEKKETLNHFLDHSKKIGAFDQIAVVEEPFEEDNDVYVGDMGINIGADESAHTIEDAARRIEQGYNTIVVKPIAKTLSMSMRIIQLAQEKKVSCFCADLTVNPILVDWNKSVAARLAPIAGMEIGLLETNGHQYYKNWKKMKSYHPMAKAEWTKVRKGSFTTGDSFYEESGGIFKTSKHYESLFNHS